jgi:DNA-binding transcriptional ArsR family regulator
MSKSITLMAIEEDTYNTIFKAMQHPIRRRILRSLSEAPETYTEMQRDLNIDNGLLNYHLDAHTVFQKNTHLLSSYY